MMFLTFMGLVFIAFGVKVSRMIKEKTSKRNNYVS